MSSHLQREYLHKHVTGAGQSTHGTKQQTDLTNSFQCLKANIVDLDTARRREVTRHTVNVIVQDLHHFDTVNDSSFCNMIQYLAPNYTIASRTHHANKVGYVIAIQ